MRRHVIEQQELAENARKMCRSAEILDGVHKGGEVRGNEGELEVTGGMNIEGAVETEMTVEDVRRIFRELREACYGVTENEGGDVSEGINTEGEVETEMTIEDGEGEVSEGMNTEGGVETEEMTIEDMRRIFRELNEICYGMSEDGEGEEIGVLDQMAEEMPDEIVEEVPHPLVGELERRKKEDMIE